MAQFPHQVWYVTEHGSISGESDMMSALQDGPIACGMCVTDGFEAYQGFGVYDDASSCTTQEHAISIVGYGSTEDGTDYWIGYVLFCFVLFCFCFVLMLNRIGNVFVLFVCVIKFYRRNSWGVC